MRRSSTQYVAYVPLATLATLAISVILLLAVGGTTLGFSVWTSKQIEQVSKDNHDCLPDRLWDNECKLGIKHAVDSHLEYCSVENRVKGYKCNDACLNTHGKCDGEGHCEGDCKFTCLDETTCPYLGEPAPGLSNVTSCLLSGCTTFVFGPDPLGMCGSEKSYQTCEDALPNAQYKGCMTTSQLCDSGLVLACVYTATCHHVEDFDPAPIVRGEPSASPNMLAAFNSARTKALFAAKK